MAAAHKVILGLKPNPTWGSDRCIDIGGASTGAGGGANYSLRNLDLGAVEYDYVYSENVNTDGAVLKGVRAKIRTMTFVIRVTGDNSLATDALKHKDLLKRIGEINWFLKLSERYYEQYKGSPPGEMTGVDGIGRRCFLTIQLSDYPNPTYFDVVGGQAVIKSDFADAVEWGINTVKEVEVTIFTQPYGYGDRVLIENLLPNPDFEELLNTANNDGTFGPQGSWGLGTGFAQSSARAKYGKKSLLYTGPGGAAATNTAAPAVGNNVGGGNTLYSVNNDKVYFSAWVYFEAAPSTANFTAIKAFMQQELSPFTRTQVATLLQVNNATPPTGYASWAAALNKWIQVSALYTVIAGTSGYYPQISIEAPNNEPSGYKFYVDGLAAFKNPVNDTLPTEYLGYGGANDAPSFDIYDIRGEVETPCLMVIENGFEWGASQVVGGATQNIGPNDYPLPVIHKLENTTTGTRLSSVGVSAPTYLYNGYGDYSAGSVPGLWSSPAGDTYQLDCFPRKYLVYLHYALSDAKAGTMTKCDILLPNGARLQMRTDIPATFTGTGVPSPFNDVRTVLLGEAFVTEPGVPWADTSKLSPAGKTSLDVAFTSGSGAFLADALIFIPVDNATFGYTVPTAMITAFLSNEGVAPTGGVSQRAGVGQPTGNPFKFDSYYIKGKLTSFNLMLTPGSTIHGALLHSVSINANAEILDVRPAPSRGYRLGIGYNPRYLYLRND